MAGVEPVNAVTLAVQPLALCLTRHDIGNASTPLDVSLAPMIYFRTILAASDDVTVGVTSLIVQLLPSPHTPPVTDGNVTVIVSAASVDSGTADDDGMQLTAVDEV